MKIEQREVKITKNKDGTLKKILLEKLKTSNFKVKSKTKALEMI